MTVSQLVITTVTWPHLPSSLRSVNGVHIVVLTTRDDGHFFCMAKKLEVPPLT